MRPLDAGLPQTGVPDPQMNRGLWCFAGILGTGIAIVLCPGFIPALQDYTMVIVAVMFLAAGISSCLLCGMGGTDMAKQFLRGVVSILPAVLMILMASSIRYTLEEANILDTILHESVVLAQKMPGWLVILFIYLIVLVMNFFIPSGSAKAFILIPLIVPLAQVFGLSSQLCVVAFAFWRWIFQCILPHQSCSTDRPRPGRCQLWRLVQMECEVSAFEFGSDQFASDLRSVCRILIQMNPQNISQNEKCSGEF